MDGYTSLTHIELADRLSLSDPKAYEEAYKRYFKILYRYAYKRLKDVTQSKDVVQDVFLRLLKGKIAIKKSKPIVFYLLKSVKNEIIDMNIHNGVRAKYLKHLTDLLNDSQNETDDLVAKKERMKILQQEIDKLPPRMRTIFEMAREGYRRNQIAAAINVSEETVKKQLYNAIKTLKKRLKDRFLLELMLFILLINR